MNLFMHKNLKIVLPMLAAAMIAVACDDDNNGVPGEPILPPGESDGGGYEEVEPERPEYVNANLVYYGNDGVSESSDGALPCLPTAMAGSRFRPTCNLPMASLWQWNTKARSML